MCGSVRVSLVCFQFSFSCTLLRALSAWRLLPVQVVLYGLGKGGRVSLEQGGAAAMLTRPPPQDSLADACTSTTHPMFKPLQTRSQADFEQV